jgi:hypothetical protein
MHWLRRLGRAERVVLVVALGVVLGALGSFVGAQASQFPMSQTAYAPLTLFEPEGLHPWVELLLWVALAIAWAACSIAILRIPGSE